MARAGAGYKRYKPTPTHDRTRLSLMRDSRLENTVIILAGTKKSGNVGAVARAMRNMGLRELRLAAPQCTVDEEAQRMARSGNTVLAEARIFPSVKGALRGIRLLAGTTGKTGGNRRRAQTPRSLAPRILAQAAQQKVGILFGPEDTGLVDEHLLLCHMLSRIPTDPRARSVNLAQAVMIFCYEMALARLESDRVSVPKLAPFEQVEAMYAQLESALLQMGFLHHENSRHMMFALRRLLGRAGLEAPKVAILRGIARQIHWYANTRFIRS